MAHRAAALRLEEARHQMGVTIKEVAKEAGVSIATVSRVFNSSGPVNEDTKQKILDVAQRLRYMPHGAARSLITSKTHTLGVLLPDLYGEFFSEVIRGIDHAARGAGYHVLLSSSHAERKEVEAALQAMRGRVDGMIIMHPDIDADVLKRNLSSTIPVVLISSLNGATPFHSLNIDNYNGAVEAVRHLLEHGHKRVAIVRGARANYDADERLRGYRDALREAGITKTFEADGDFTERAGYRAGKKILEMSPRPTAVFASNDAMAIGALGAFREAGIDVPGDIAVVSFDDIPIAAYVNPPLTSVHVSINDLGAQATGYLIETVEGQREPGSEPEVLPARLIVRQSCGCGVSD